MRNSFEEVFKLTIADDRKSFKIGEFPVDKNSEIIILVDRHKHFPCNIITRYNIVRQKRQSKNIRTMPNRSLKIKELFFEGCSQLFFNDGQRKVYEKLEPPYLKRRFMFSDKDFKNLANDINSNVFVICLAFEKDPIEVKKLLGRGAWAKVHKNSLEFNNLIADYIVRYSRSAQIIESVKELLNAKNMEKLKFATTVCARPSIIKKYLNNDDYNSSFRVFVTTHNDTLRMKRELEEYYNHNWSWARLLREHDDAAIRYTFKVKNILMNERYPLSEYAEFKIQKTRQDLEYKFLKRGGDYFEESIKMKHCISSYAKKAKNEQYIAIHTSHEGYEATIGISTSNYIHDNNAGKFDQILRSAKIEQIKGVRNDSKIPTPILDFAYEVIKILVS